MAVNKLDEVLTGNSRGQMKVWDLRSYSNAPETSFTLSGGQVRSNKPLLAFGGGGVWIGSVTYVT